MLDIVDVYKNITDRQKRRKEVFKHVLLLCERQVKNVSNSDGLKCVHVVPEFIWGMPLYNVAECASYVKTELENAGFNVALPAPRVLVISWDMSDLERKTTQLLQANAHDHQLIEKPKRDLIAGKRKFVLNLA
jgi:hypothetical protein